MNKQTNVIVGVVLLILCIGGMWYWMTTTKPDDAEIDAQSEHVVPANAQLLSEKSLQNIQSRTIYGDIPVTVEENYNHADIFN